MWFDSDFERLITLVLGPAIRKCKLNLANHNFSIIQNNPQRNERSKTCILSMIPLSSPYKEKWLNEG